MANHKSALKRARQTEKRNARNRALRSTFRTHIKKFNAFLDAKDYENAAAELPNLHKTIDTAVTKGIIHKNNAARRKSRLTQAINKAKAA